MYANIRPGEILAYFASFDVEFAFGTVLDVNLTDVFEPLSHIT